jgi:hypothetical protein
MHQLHMNLIGVKRLESFRTNGALSDPRFGALLGFFPLAQMELVTEVVQIVRVKWTRIRIHRDVVSAESFIKN